MATANTKPPVSQKTHDAIVDYISRKRTSQARLYNLRARMQQIDRVYQREVDWTLAQQRAKVANLSGDISKMQNAVIPVVMPQTESLLNFLSETFLSSYPIFAVLSKPQMMTEALQMETVIGEQGVEFAWATELLAAMRDTLKYNLCAVEVDWVEKKTYTVTSDATADIKHGTATKTQFAGNAIKRRDPYNLILDTRVPPFEIHTRGEYAGYVEMISKIEMKQRIAELDPTMTMRVKDAFESGDAAYSMSPSSTGFFIPQVNPDAMVTVTELTGAPNWDAWAGIEEDPKIKYAGRYEWTVMYCKILPVEFGMISPAANTPQIWKFITINGKVCIYAQRMSNAHNYLPLICAQAHEDGLSWQSKSFADNAAPFQALATALFNSGLESQRRKVYDRIIYDPSKINKADIEKTSPVARIPIKTEAYGTPLSEVVYQLPYRDDNANQVFQVSQQVLDMADVANGQNRVQRGQFQKGNKTRSEYEDTMNNSDSRPRMVALVLENRLFQPIKQILKLNTLQYQPPGTSYNRNTKQPVDIDPVAMRAAALEFKIADGVMPTSKFINFETFDKLLNVAAQNPMVSQRFDIVGAFMYYLKLQGASWIDDFVVQQPQQVMPGQQPGMPAQPQMPPQ